MNLNMTSQLTFVGEYHPAISIDTGIVSAIADPPLHRWDEDDYVSCLQRCCPDNSSGIACRTGEKCKDKWKLCALYSKNHATQHFLPFLARRAMSTWRSDLPHHP
jgi:hypothetical protein